MPLTLVLGAPFGVVFDLGCLEWVIAGLIGGWLAGLIVRGRGFGCVGNILLGIAGAFVAAFLLQIFAPSLINDHIFRFTGTAVLAFLGALVLTLIGRLIGGSNRAGR
jgi:uncharacterized membrane protein YeaQ/YmgE (transglycosylase-associated protein family)